jgi:fatty acid desaturase
MRNRSWYARQASVELVVFLIAGVFAALLGFDGKTGAMFYLIGIAAVALVLFALFGRHDRMHRTYRS